MQADAEPAHRRRGRSAGEPLASDASSQNIAAKRATSAPAIRSRRGAVFSATSRRP